MVLVTPVFAGIPELRRAAGDGAARAARRARAPAAAGSRRSRRRSPRRARVPSETTCAGNERPSAESSGRQIAPRDGRDDRRRDDDADRRRRDLAPPSSRPIRRRSTTSSAHVPAMLQIAVASGIPQTPSHSRARSRGRAFRNRLPSAIHVGTQFDCRLKNARFSISIAPLKTSPALNAASAAATTGVWFGRELAALEEQAHDRLREHRAHDGGRHEQERDLPQADARPCRGSRRMPCRARRRRSATASGRARSRSRPRTSPAAACRRGTPSGSRSARGSDR